LVTNGSTNHGTTEIVYTQLEETTGNLIFSTYYGGNAEDEASDISIVGGNAYIFGTSRSTNFPVTNGSTITPTPGGNPYDLVYTKIDIATGAINFATYLGGSEVDYAKRIIVEGGRVHLLTQTASHDFPMLNGATTPALFTSVYTQFDATTNVMTVSRFLGGSVAEEIPEMVFKNGALHFTGYTNSYNYPVTNGSHSAYAFSADDIVYTKLDAATGAILFSTFIGGTGAGYATSKIAVDDNTVDIISLTYEPSYPTTDGSTTTGGGDIAYTKINHNTGEILYSTFMGPSYESIAIEVSSEGTHIITLAGSNDFPVTNGSSFQGGTDIAYTQYRFCPPTYSGSTALTPATQSVCQNSVLTTIKGGEVVATGLPTLYVSGAARLQNKIEAKYQWQEATAAAGPWTNIVGAQLQNYTPQIALTNKYYRRIARSLPYCGSVVVSTSAVAEVLLLATTAPAANAGGIFNTCIGTAVNIGNATIATGGLPPYTILWDNGLGAVAQPSVAPSIPSVYTLKITDANGCFDYDQAIVNPFAADAGIDVGNCGGNGVRIGAAPIAGVAGVTYAWTASPADPTMSCTNCAQPTVNPTVATTYTLTLTIPVTGAGTCTTTDNTIVTPVAPPTTANNAGTDVVICIGSTAPLGTAAQSGFVYTWAPGNYLTSNATSTTTFQPGSLSMPNQNPGLYYLTAIKGGCSFVDEVETAVIEARAGVDGCGPRLVGDGDRTPNINETYTWTKISGPGNFSGVTNLPKVPVTASVGGPTVYQLAVSYTLNGVTQTCTDQVIVPNCGCVVDIDVVAPYACPSFGLNGGSVQLVAAAADIYSNDPTLFSYTWSPAAGLSATTGATVSLTDNINRTYTVTMGSPFDPSFNCTRTIEVNHPAWSLPVFTAQDPSICAGQSAAIGAATVAGYSYLWTGTNLSSNTISNPTASPTTTTSYPVLVTDVGSGCTVSDIATVTIANPIANAGPDILVCNAGSVVLGTPTQPNTTYQWSPSGGVTYLNGTSSTSAQPEFIVATTSTYTVLVTNTLSGCTRSDAVTVTVGTPVSPFTLPNINYCPSGGAVTLNAGGAPAGMSSYQWSPASQVVSPNSATTTTLNPPSGAGGTFSLTVKNASGCSYTAMQTITPTVPAPIVTSSQVICYNTNPTLNESVALGGAAVSGATYSWSPTTGLNNAISSNPTFTPTSISGATTFTVTKVEGGCTSTAQVTVIVNGMALPALANPTVCQNSSVQIGTLPLFGTTYSWTPTTGLDDPNIANPLATLSTQTRIYTLTAVGMNGCVATATVTVGVNPLPSPTINLPDVSACLGNTSTVFNPTITPTGTYNYEWSPNNGTLSSIYTAAPHVNLTGIGTTQYTVMVTNPTTGCSNTSVANLTVTSCAAAPVGSVGNYVWNDSNGNGINDEGGTGINGVTVELWNATTNTLVSSTATANNASSNAGYYNFVITANGNYYIKFPTTNGAKILTNQTTTADTDNNSDANISTGSSPTFTININGTGIARDNMTIDAGYICAPACIPITITKTN
jgi:hypothetical protein